MFYTIRELAPHEFPLLEGFTYEAIFQREGEPLLPRNVLRQPDLRVYYENFGQPHDHCLVADANGQVVGAVWARILNGTVKGFGQLDDDTPEFAISLYKPYQNKGIGTALMRQMLALLKARGYRQASLAVQKDNYALKMYQKVGFITVKELELEYLMVCPLNEAPCQPPAF